MSSEVSAVNGQTALRFDGGDDYLTVADESNFDQLKYLTVVVVGQARSGIGGWEPFVSKRGESNQGWQMRRQGGNNYATFTVRGTSGADDPASSTAIVDHWRLYIGTYDGAKRKLWVDGNLEIGGKRVTSVCIYRTGKYDAIYPPSDSFIFPDEGVRFDFSEDRLSYLLVRPSGTGNSLRFHVQLHSPVTGADLIEKKAELRAAAKEIVDDLRNTVGAPR